MAYDNINSSISKYSQKVILTWILLSILAISCVLFYYIKTSEHDVLQKNALYLTEINSEASLLLNKNIIIDPSKTSLNSWTILYKDQFLALMPGAEAEINLLAKLGQQFYLGLNKKNMEEKFNKYQEFYDQIELIKRLISSTIKSSLLGIFLKIALALYVGCLFICIFLTLKGASTLSKKIITKNSIILENIWEELQSIDWNAGVQESQQQELNIEPLDLLQTYTQKLSTKLHSTQQHIDHYIAKAKTTTFNIETEKQIQKYNTHELKEKILLMQKLLSRLFTRAERASTLAKASSDNGFQAGILALNISIEASKAGESGKVFLSVSDRVKNFAEKSSNIGHSIIEELRDADLAVRKAYAVGKNLIEILPEEQNIDQTKINQTISMTPEFDFSALDETYEYIEQMHSIATQIQHQSTMLQQQILDQATHAINREPSISDTKMSLIRDGLVKNFEQLYRNTYGIDPVISQDL
ncbi:MAG: methyl-accepting chemotaxis protein [Brevinema sp.]